MLLDSRFSEFAPAIDHLSHMDSLEKNHLLTSEFLIKRENKLAMYYAPHNEYVNTRAQIVMVGITPGWKQMRTAMLQVINHLHSDKTKQQLLKQAKIAASFSGQMRSNLTTMLDQCGLQDVLGLQTTGQLFTNHRSSLHTTSVIRYPVFYNDKNYTGHTPSIKQSNMLQYYAYKVFPRELKTLKRRALIIPLGKVVEERIRHVQGLFDQDHTYLFGFPHPSGANGHRVKQLTQNFSNLKDTIKRWGNNQSIS